MRRYLLLSFEVPLVLAAVVACSSGTGGPVQDPTFGPAATPASSSTGGASAPASTAPASTAPAGSAAAPGLAAVAGATDLTTRPTVAPGTDAPSVLVVRDLVVGTGPAVDASATVNLKYVGTIFSTGAVFDASWGSAGSAGPDTASFALNAVIPGFAQGLVGMKAGGRREIVIPPALGYGASATGKIPANSTLVFVVDLVSTSG